MAITANQSEKLLAFDRIYKGDARALASRLLDRSIAVTLTSPPYWTMKDYGVPGQIGWDQNYDQYMEDLIAIFHHVHRATRDSGSLWVVLDTFKAKGRLNLLPFEFSDRLQRETGWKLQDVVIWDKGKTLPWSRAGQMRNQFEYILCFSKGKDFKYEIDRLKEIELKEWWVKYPERYNPKGKVPSNIWTLPIPVQGSWSSNGLRHACPFPVSLVERVLLLTTDPKPDHIVFDPFAGSGIVLALAEQMRRGFLGFELNPKFIEMYQTVVKQFVGQEWALRSEQLKTLDGKRKALHDQILRLRLTKYPKTLIKELENLMSESMPIFRGILAVAPVVPPAVTSQSKRHHLLSLNVYLICEDIQNRKAFEGMIQKVASRPPLSKFGINAQVFLLTLKEVGNLQPRFGLAADEPLWLYRNGRTHKFSRRTTKKEWLEAVLSSHKIVNDRPKFPAIASNVPVSQKIERTWFSKKQGTSFNEE